MNNEPVAWMSQGGDVSRSVDYFEEMGFKDLIPLYTHPVKELDEQFKKGFEAGKEEGWKAHKFHHPVKELTDEEIIAVGNAVTNLIDSNEGWIEFARAILKKASEK
jgi:hypothetical protein